MFNNGEYRRLKRQFKRDNTYNFVDLYINEKTRQVFIDNHGLINNLAMSFRFSLQKYHLYDFSEIVVANATFDRQGEKIASVTYSILFNDGYQYDLPISMLPMYGNSIEAQTAREITEKLDIIFRDSIIENNKGRWR